MIIHFTSFSEFVVDDKNKHLLLAMFFFITPLSKVLFFVPVAFVTTTMFGQAAATIWGCLPFLKCWYDFDMYKPISF